MASIKRRFRRYLPTDEHRARVAEGMRQSWQRRKAERLADEAAQKIDGEASQADTGVPAPASD